MKAEEPAPAKQDASTGNDAISSVAADKLSQEKFPIGCVVIGSSTRHKEKYDAVRGKVDEYVI